MYIYYVYAYLRESNGTPYYIGKGKKYRAYAKHGKIPVPNDDSRIVFLEKNLSDIGACALERRYIKWYGRKDLKTGILLNRTDGGEGTSGRKWSAHTREKMQRALKGRPGKKHSQETIEVIRAKKKGISKSIEHIEKLRKANLGKSLSEETKLKMSIARKKYLLNKG